ncbi:hypothetical protein [Flavobacterium tiangeerense]|uniref:hypothetical protein n=1 Tax=Flavobacterium tiangeerense TaxID=459471 RepID=UPI0011A2075A|nr:hypothetical protein [Flavobacterium tiangeerense]
MKKSLLFLFMLLVNFSFAQSINNYKAVIVPLKFDFLKVENQYRMNTLTKYNFEKAGFVAFYKKAELPQEYYNRCDLLFADVVKENGFLTTKLVVVLKDCNDKIIFQSVMGSSREKEYQVAYAEALNKAFVSILNLKYKYNGTKAIAQDQVVEPASKDRVMIQKNTNEVVTTMSQSIGADLLYAQATSTGFQLIDSSPKVVMKLLKTSQKNSFIAIKGDIQGSLILKENQWYFEYYKSDVLVSEKINVKF